ncbi:hypothetical protein DM02DRAFT_729270 [Periconia macrospinosa]|uniref:Uncharacterized protein n=1 Tax=Periconia macrospinosa TaxID=97972 RepID=A0A2V1DM99_9PLEO|nr:hypothetical protein DM02DRAFT_729270 [Periconia macrospinosa]
MSTPDRTLPMAYEDLMKPNEDWRNLPDTAERRKLQNRLAQRAYRRNLRERNNEVEQLKQKIRELQEAAAGTAPPQQEESNAADGIPVVGSTFDPPMTNLTDAMQDAAILEGFDFLAFENNMQTPLPFPPPPTPQQEQDQTEKTTTTHNISLDFKNPSTSSSKSSSSTPSSPRQRTRAPRLTRNSTSATVTSPMNPEIGSLWDQTNLSIGFPSSSLCLVHLAVAAGNADTLRILLHHGLPVNMRDQAGYTPLQRAVISGRTDLVIILLENGAGPSCDDENDWSMDADLVAGL